MTDKHNEHLSALVDGEDIDASVLDSMLEDDAQKQQFQRYQLASSIIRNEAQPGFAVDISAAVAAQVAAEPSLQMPAKRWWQKAANDSWWRPAASFAVAASVALVTVIGVQNYQLSPEQSGADQVPAENPLFEARPLGGVGNPVSFNAVQEAPMLQQGAQGSDQRRLIQSFFVDHQQQLQLSQQEQEAAEQSSDNQPESQPE
ncbi:sigma-E factor negative regulatory protein [Aliidiomarina maris]|uniref:Anti-sigma-E factor RseA n=1 Tax=Aliidiomarina maris TaxID=531312 RepID=A0A327X3G9_9GAMM|nr:RseA family anti-sigma factor [Aliidiomarina maris]RAK01487.1 RseA-like anti sigma(E) protein [Aliidiomarina maris]RUO28324.1 hypothetical protein CWE07_00525 [Aliidiomarina maris]